MWKCKNCKKINEDEYKLCIHCFKVKNYKENSTLELSKKLEYCKLCVNSEFESKRGIICSLTKQKPDFKESCNDFSITEKTKQKIEIFKRKLKGENFEANSKTPRWTITLFGAVGYLSTKYLIFSGEHNFLTGVASFVIAAAIGTLILNSLSNK